MDCSGLRDDLLDVLYAEASPEVRRRVEAHLTTCAPCRDELAGLRAVRAELQGWEAPALRPVPVRRTVRRSWPVAAAAALVLATLSAFALRGSEVRYEEGRLSLRFGSPAAPDRDALASLEARHAREIEALRAEVRSLGRRAEDGGALLQQVTDLIRQSEARQAARLETGIAGLAQQAETRRRYDLARIGAGLAYIDAKNGHQFSRTTELVGHVLEASQKRGER